MHSRLFGSSAYPSASFMLFALFFVAVVHCAAAGTAVAVTHAPTRRAITALRGSCGSAALRALKSIGSIGETQNDCA
jgi:hypothetical protein